MASEQPGAHEARPSPPEVSSARLQILATEHWSLLATRSLIYSESFSRVSLFLTVLTGAVVGLALLAQVGHFNSTFVVAAILILSVVVFVGVVTVGRLSALNRENFFVVEGMNRLRHAYLEMQPDLEKYFVASGQDDIRGVLLSMGLPRTPGSASAFTNAFEGLQTLPAMVLVVVALVSGVLAAVIAEAFGATTGVAIVVGAITFVAMNISFGFLAQRAFFRFAKNMAPRFPSADST
ncbi:MAG TPA: hypothetical protein VGD57_01920 [Candidatus Dormibacteraeota bacterium]